VDRPVSFHFGHHVLVGVLQKGMAEVRKPAAFVQRVFHHYLVTRDLCAQGGGRMRRVDNGVRWMVEIEQALGTR